MFVYFCLAGKQWIAKKGDKITYCPYVQGQEGDIVYTEEVLGLNDQIGDKAGKYIKGAKVELKILKQGKKKKIRIVNFRPQKRHEKWKGFRERYTDLEVTNIYWSESQ